MSDLAMRPARLAYALSGEGARFVVVGGAARLLLSGAGRPRDLDIVVDEPDLPELVAALGALGVPANVSSLARARLCQLISFWGPLDVFVGSPPAFQPLRLGGLTLMVAA